MAIKWLFSFGLEQDWGLNNLFKNVGSSSFPSKNQYGYYKETYKYKENALHNMLVLF